MPFDRAHYTQLLDTLLANPPTVADFTGTFDGPKIDLHLHTLDARRSAQTSATHYSDLAWNTYCTLTAWGMNNQAAKMPRYAVFEESVISIRKGTLELWEKQPPLDEPGWERLRLIFYELRATMTNSLLVANSKVLCHLLPQLVAPIDRKYALKFFGVTNDWLQNKSGAVDRAWEVLRETHEYFYYPLLGRPQFKALAGSWQHEMCTSPLKTADNLIVGFQNARRRSSTDCTTAGD